MIRLTFVPVSFLLLLTLAFGGCVTVPSVHTPASISGPIDPTRLSETVRMLASDEFEGRAPGTRGEAKTVAYLSREFEALGLTPGGENGSWTQTVPLIRTQLQQPGAIEIGGQQIGRLPVVETAREALAIGGGRHHQQSQRPPASST